MSLKRTPKPFWGKLIGFVIGMIVLPPLGGLIGLVIGHIIDVRAAQAMPRDKGSQKAYLHGLFACMGHIAKLDGQVSKREIDYASQVMSRLHLTAAHREEAMKSFYQGKRADFDLNAILQQVRQAAGGRSKLLYLFINAQVQMAYADGVVKDQLKPVLQQMARALGVMQLNFAYYDAIFGWQQRWQQQQYHYQQQTGGSSYQQHESMGQSPFSGSLSAAYKLLGVTEKATDAELKKAYRRLMSKYHPDKLMSKGLSEQEMQQATEKVQRIKAAYEQIRRSRGL